MDNAIEARPEIFETSCFFAKNISNILIAIFCYCNINLFIFLLDRLMMLIKSDISR
jgi:hypothetical protein